MNFVSNISALTVFIISGQVDYIVGLCKGLSVRVGEHFSLQLGRESRDIKAQAPRNIQVDQVPGDGPPGT